MVQVSERVILWLTVSGIIDVDSSDGDGEREREGGQGGGWSGCGKQHPIIISSPTDRTRIFNEIISAIICILDTHKNQVLWLGISLFPLSVYQSTCLSSDLPSCLAKCLSVHLCIRFPFPSQFFHLLDHQLLVLFTYFSIHDIHNIHFSVPRISLSIFL